MPWHSIKMRRAAGPCLKPRTYQERDALLRWQHYWERFISARQHFNTWRLVSPNSTPRCLMIIWNHRWWIQFSAVQSCLTVCLPVSSLASRASTVFTDSLLEYHRYRHSLTKKQAVTLDSKKHEWHDWPPAGYLRHLARAIFITDVQMHWDNTREQHSAIFCDTGFSVGARLCWSAAANYLCLQLKQSST